MNFENVEKILAGVNFKVSVSEMGWVNYFRSVR